MKSGLVKHAAIAFVLALALYAGSFSIIEHLRVRRGGWELTFGSDAAAVPLLSVSQRALGLTNIQLRFSGERIAETNLSRLVLFDRPMTNVPFGMVLFFDTTFLPGTLTLELFGHEIELMPRTLVVNQREVPWKPDLKLVLSPQDKLPPERRKPRLKQMK